MLEHYLGVADDEEGADLSSLPPFTCDLDREVYHPSERPVVHPAPLGADLIEQVRQWSRSLAPSPLAK
jgi:hypothetical protein